MEGSIVKRNKTRVNEISLTPVQKRRVIHREHPSFPINVAFFPSPSDIIMAGHKGLGNGYRSTRKGTRRNETYEPVRVCVCGDNTHSYTRLDALTGVLETGGRHHHHENHRLCSATGAALRLGDRSLVRVRIGVSIIRLGGSLSLRPIVDLSFVVSFINACRGFESSRRSTRSNRPREFICK